MRIIEALKRDDNGLSKGLIILGAAGLGVAVIVGLRRWQQKRQGGSGCTDIKPKPATDPKSTSQTTPTKPVTKPSDSSSATKPVTTPVSPPSAPTPVQPVVTPPSVTPPVIKPPTPAAPVSKPAEDNISTLRDAGKPASSPLKDSGAPPPKPSAPSSAAAEPPKPAASAPPPSPSKPPPKDDLSMSSTFEKVSADGGSLSSKHNEDILHDVSRKPLHSSPPKGDGGAKSLIEDDVMFNSSIESPVFGGQTYSMLSDVEVEASTFDPATQHPAMFGFKFDGPSS